MLLGRQSGTSDSITLGRNIIYHSILNDAVRQTYFYKLFDHTWQEQNIAFLSDQPTQADIPIQVI